MKTFTLAIFYLVLASSTIYAQEIMLFNISDSNNKTLFISLSDIYPLSDHIDSLAIPEESSEEHFTLNSKYRKRFLTKTKIAETDKVFLYDYVQNELLSFTVKNLNVVANISPYKSGDETPFSQYDYMIGFEIDKKLTKVFGDNSYEILVAVGKKNPFAGKQLTAIVWKKINSKEFPSKKIKDEFGYLEQEYTIGDSYLSKFEDLEYFIQNLIRNKSTFARRLLVVNTKTNEIIYDELFCENESDSLAPLNFINKEEGNTPNQWTGKLFNNKETVIFGFEYHSFSCPEITVLGKKPTHIGIYCDNRH
ncbi:hypothetical protein J2X31_002347 [Flavobacterium arsenatis]|uniref:Oxidoreductase n=1 Tax=Flavobacterium arsenatis TaxID=1484332 RepID=A0ABU1TQT5_9FLAO|nr:oxidoreductase [Flavobacterium arsenatis]MDR6968330.1 hypothetical protein [Flavobacterium arsenatis]